MFHPSPIVNGQNEFIFPIVLCSWWKDLEKSLQFQYDNIVYNLFEDFPYFPARFVYQYINIIHILVSICNNHYFGFVNIELHSFTKALSLSVTLIYQLWHTEKME